MVVNKRDYVVIDGTEKMETNMRKCSWTKEELETFLRESAQKTAAEWAVQLGKPEGTIRRVASTNRVKVKTSKRESSVATETYIKEHWNQKTPQEIADDLGMIRKTVYSVARRLNLPPLLQYDHKLEDIRKAQAASTEVQRRRAKEEATEKFGEWSREKAYILGVAWTDLTVTSDGIAHGAAVTDLRWVQKIAAYCGVGVRIDAHTHQNGVSLVVEWCWNNRELSRMLEGWGIERGKSKKDLEYLDIPDEYFSHFARGVQDGDGSPTKTTLRWYGSPKFMEGFADQAAKLWGVKRPCLMDHAGGLKALQWGAKEDVERIRDLLYKDCGDWFLERKEKEGRRKWEELDWQGWWNNGVITGEAVQRTFEAYRRNGFPYPRELEDVDCAKVLQNLRDRSVPQGYHNTITALEVLYPCFPHIWDTVVDNRITPVRVFEDDVRLLKVIENRWKYGKGLFPSQLLIGLRLASACPAMFRPMLARTIIQRHTPQGGIVVDPCAGYGGRMLGAWAAQRSYKGFEPEKRNYAGNQLLLKRLKGGNALSVVNVPMEEGDWGEQVDLVFTCPPYYAKEDYGKAPELSHNRYSTYSTWKSFFLKTLLQRAYKTTKEEGRLVLVVGDWGTFKLVDDTKEIAEKVGWVLTEEVDVEQQKAPQKKSRPNEKILVWVKKTSANIQA